MRNCRTGESVSVVSDSAVLVMFVRAEVEGNERNIPEWHKVMLKQWTGK